MAIFRPVRLGVLADHLRGRLDSLTVKGESPGRKANLHSQNIQKRLDGLDMLIYPDLNAHVLDLLSIGVHEVESLIGFIVRIEIAVHLPLSGSTTVRSAEAGTRMRFLPRRNSRIKESKAMSIASRVSSAF